MVLLLLCILLLLGVASSIETDSGTVLATKSYTDISPSDTRDWRDSGADIVILDVREQSEWDDGHIPDAILMPWVSEYLSNHHEELPDKPIIVHCRSGGRSAHAASFLENNGHSDVYNMTGGFLAWASMSAPEQTLIDSYFFDTSSEGWTFNGEVPPYDIPQATYDDGSLNMTPQGSTNCFSYWLSPNIPVEARKYYRSAWTISSDVTDPNEAVEFRLRVTQKGSWQSWYRTVASNLSNSPSEGNPGTYEVIFDPCVTGSVDNNVVLAFDIASFAVEDDTNSTVSLDEVVVDQASLFTSKEVGEYSFESDAEGWLFQGEVAPYDTPNSLVSNGTIGLSPQDSWYCFSYMYSPDFTIDDGKTYRAVWTLASDTPTTGTCPQFRLRANQKATWSSWNRVVSSNLGNAPWSAEDKEYSLFFDPGVSGSSDDKMVFSFDLMSFAPDDDLNAEVYLDNVLIEEITIQP